MTAHSSKPCHATYSQYARLMKCSVRCIQNYVRTLRDAGWIETMPQPGEITIIRPLVARERIKHLYSANSRGASCANRISISWNGERV